MLPLIPSSGARPGKELSWHILLWNLHVAMEEEGLISLEKFLIFRDEYPAAEDYSLFPCGCVIVRWFFACQEKLAAC